VFWSLVSAANSIYTTAEIVISYTLKYAQPTGTTSFLLELFIQHYCWQLGLEQIGIKLVKFIQSL